MSFTKGPLEEIFIIGFDVEAKQLSVQQTTKVDEIADTVLQSTTNCKGLRGDDFSACMADGVLDRVETLKESKEELAGFYSAIASRLRNYTCADNEMESTQPIDQLAYKFGGKEYTIDTLLDTPHAKIWKSDEFISEEECKV